MAVNSVTAKVIVITVIVNIVVFPLFVCLFLFFVGYKVLLSSQGVTWMVLITVPVLFNAAICRVGRCFSWRCVRSIRTVTVLSSL